MAEFQTGGVGTSQDFAGVGEYGSFGCGSEGEFWVMNGTPKILRHFAGYGGTGLYFSTKNPNGSSIFTLPAAGTFNLQRGVRDATYQPVTRSGIYR